MNVRKFSRAIRRLIAREIMWCQTVNADRTSEDVPCSLHCVYFCLFPGLVEGPSATTHARARSHTHTHTTIDGIILLLNTMKINWLHLQTEFHHVCLICMETSTQAALILCRRNNCMSCSFLSSCWFRIGELLDTILLIWPMWTCFKRIHILW
jgi:hypothetical protein